jgi:hypothetical protein
MTHQFSFETIDIELEPEFDEQEGDAFGEFEGEQEGGFDTENYEEEWSEEADPDAHKWPRERRFNPGPATTIPSGPYRTGTGRCAALDEDLMQLTVSVGSFRRSVELLTRLTQQKPRNQQLIDDAGKKARREIPSLKINIQKMRDQANKGCYRCSGCTRADLAKILSKITKLDGPWRTKHAEVNKLWKQLVCCLKCEMRPCRC